MPDSTLLTSTNRKSSQEVDKLSEKSNETDRSLCLSLQPDKSKKLK